MVVPRHLFISKGNQCQWLFPLQVPPHMGVVVRGPNPVVRTDLIGFGTIGPEVFGPARAV